jgi:hypothetical protein
MKRKENKGDEGELGREERRGGINVGRKIKEN